MKPNKNWNTWKSILALSTLACAITPALAEEDDDLADENIGSNTIIVTGSRSESNLLDTSDAISVISQEEIDRVKFVDAREELLSRIPGNSMGRNLRWSLSSKNYTVNLLDGIMMRPFGKGYTSSINETNSWDIERIEVIRGPASALFGSHAIGGVINIITKEPPGEREINLWTDVGAWGRARGGVSIGNTYDNFGYSVNVNALKLDGFRDRTSRKEKAFTSKGVWTISDEKKLTVRVEFQDTIIDQPGTLSQEEFDEDWGQATINDAYEDTQFNTLLGSYEHQISDDISTKVIYSGRKRVVRGPTALSYKSGYVDDDSMDHNLVIESHWDFTKGQSKLVAGADIQHSDVNETSLEWDTNESTIPGDSEKNWDLLADVISPFTQLQFTPVDWAEFTLGVRYDNIKYSGTDLLGTLGTLESEYTNFSTKAGVSFKITESDRLWFSYGEGFMVPSRSRLFTSIATMRRGRWSGYFSDPDLKPETAVNYSIGLRGTTNDNVMGYDLTFYSTDIEDMVVGVDRGGSDRVYVNAGEVHGEGLEAAFNYSAMDNLQFSGAYTYADHQYTDFVDGGTSYTGNTLSSSPFHHLNGRVTYTPIDFLDIELEVDHSSGYYTSSANDDPEGKYKRPELVHLKADYETGVWSVWIQVRNLTDEKYAEGVSNSSYSGRSYSPGEPRSFNIGFRYSFL